MNYYVITEADFLKNCLTYENTDLDTFLAGPKSQLPQWGSNIFFTQWMDHLFKDSRAFHSLIPEPDQKNNSLRC